MHALIEAKIQQLVEELQRADEEANKLRPRLRYLEEVMVRADGALTVLKGLLEGDPAASVNHAGADARSD
jgi:hypothetical protein